ncbi:hypothetical protein PTKIN_Ptkin12aG0079500 [Pterospermum kingtungense]
MSSIATESSSQQVHTAIDLISGDKGDLKATYKRTWTTLFGFSNDFKDPIPSLEFYPLKSSAENSDPFVALPSKVLDDGKSQWKNALVARFVSEMPNFSRFSRIVNQLWGSKGEVDIRLTGSNMFILQFPNDREPGLESLSFNLQKVPLWVHLVNVSLEAFNKTGLSYIASALGTLLYMDRITAKQQRLTYAKICVEDDAFREIPKGKAVIYFGIRSALREQMEISSDVEGKAEQHVEEQHLLHQEQDSDDDDGLDELGSSTLVRI